MSLEMLLLCRRKHSGSEGAINGAVPVYLNIYDLTTLNGYAYWLGLGAYHSAVQVHGVEYAYGAHEDASTGVYQGTPKQCEGFTFRKSLVVGCTDFSSEDVATLMEELALHYTGMAYNLITNNCNHFSNDVCIRLTGNAIPSWVNRLARIGFLCNCILPASLRTTKIVDESSSTSEDNVDENDRKLFESPEASSRRTPSLPPALTHGHSLWPSYQINPL